MELVRSASRSMVQGSLEGVKAAMGAWMVVLGLGFAAAFLGAVALVVWAVRRPIVVERVVARRE
jgi:hypothetical protein